MAPTLDVPVLLNLGRAPTSAVHGFFTERLRRIIERTLHIEDHLRNVQMTIFSRRILVENVPDSYSW